MKRFGEGGRHSPRGPRLPLLVTSRCSDWIPSRSPGLGTQPEASHRCLAPLHGTNSHGVWVWVCVKAAHCCILGSEGLRAPQALPHRSPSGHPQQPDRQVVFPGPTKLHVQLWRGTLGIFVGAVLGHPFSMPATAVPCEQGRRSRVGSGSAPARSRSSPKTCFGKLFAPAGISSLARVRSACSGHGTGDPRGAAVPRGRSGPGLLLPVCLPALPGCGQEPGRAQWGPPLCVMLDFSPALPPAPFPHLRGQRWLRSRGTARGNDYRVGRQRRGTFVALDPPRALPRKKGVTQSRGPPSPRAPSFGGRRRLQQHRRTRRNLQRAWGTRTLPQRACGEGQGRTPTLAQHPSRLRCPDEPGLPGRW